MTSVFHRLAILLFTACVAFTSSASALEVQGVRFGVHADKTRIVTELDAAAPFRVFSLSGPYRIVVDLPTFSWSAAAPAVPPQAGVLDVRHGQLQPGLSRIVIDVAAPPDIRKVFTLPGQGRKPARLVIDFAETTPAAFARNKNTVHGTLSENTVADTLISEPAHTPGAQVAARPDFKPARDAAQDKPVQKPEPAKPVKKPLVVIDPGHGGVDPGASIPGRQYEKIVVLALAKELRRQLLSTGRYRVVMTREGDKFIRLRDRVRFARRHEADLFVSIHADSINKPAVRGASVYTLSNKASDAQTAKLAARENKADMIAGLDLDVEDEDVANILLDLAMRDTLNQSRFFANTLVKTFRGRGVRLLENPHRYAGFAVLKAPDIPSVLIEAGFMSNRREAQMLSTRSYRKKLAEAMKNGVDAYFQETKKANLSQ